MKRLYLIAGISHEEGDYKNGRAERLWKVRSAFIQHPVGEWLSENQISYFVKDILRHNIIIGVNIKSDEEEILLLLRTDDMTIERDESAFDRYK